MASAAPPADTTLTSLSQYTACDISDALLKLKVAGAGFLPNLNLYCKPSSEPEKILIGPASTVYFIDKNDDSTSHPAGNIPSDQHWVDLTKPNTIVVESQPAGQHNAVLGGIMALRMKQLGARGVVVSGRIRDLEELRETGLLVWARATSTVGTGASTKAHAVEIPITIDGITITPGDYVFCDPANGVVVIPKDKVDDVLELLPRLVGADERVKEEVRNGMSVKQAFEKHRSAL